MLLRNAKVRTLPSQFIDANTMSAPIEIVETIDVECDCGQRWTARHSMQERKGFVTPRAAGNFSLPCRQCWRSVWFALDGDVRAGLEFGEPQPEPNV
jgi:hypothetical protein